MTVAPPFPYFGGKQRIAEKIVALFPPHEHYVEPFCGGLSVLFAKRPSRMETVNDLDGLLMTFWRVLRDRPDELARACALTPHAREEYAAAIPIYRDEACDLDDLEIARRVFVIMAQGRASKTSATSWRTHVDPNGSSIGLPDYMRAYVDRLAAGAERLQHVTLESLDAAKLVDRYGIHPDVLLYCDPPYLRSSRNSYGYHHEMVSEADHRALAEQLNNAAAAVVLSGYASPLYDELYADWNRHEIPSGTAQGGTYGARTEVIWSNRDLHTGRLDFDLGSDALTPALTSTLRAYTGGPIAEVTP